MQEEIMTNVPTNFHDGSQEIGKDQGRNNCIGVEMRL